MKPPKERPSPFLQPLNRILGTEAGVRLLRVLALSTTPLTAGEVAKRASLGRTSVYPALRGLEAQGIVEFVGAGGHRLVQLRDRHPLSRPLKQLFRAEVHRFEGLVAALRDLFSDLPLRPLSAWLTQPGPGPLADETLGMNVVARPEDLARLTDLLDARLAEIERAYDAQIAVTGLTRAELETLAGTRVADFSAAILLAGVPPEALLGSSRVAAAGQTAASHDVHDARSRRLALAVAAKIRTDPGLIAAASARIRRRMQKAGAAERRELAEWMRILSTMPPARLQKFLREGSERAVRLRQTLPMLNVLSPAERDAVRRSQTDAEAVAAVTNR
jgi:DNA-binding transcriptional ArsR family regulator